MRTVSINKARNAKSFMDSGDSKQIACKKAGISTCYFNTWIRNPDQLPNDEVPKKVLAKEKAAKAFDLMVKGVPLVEALRSVNISAATYYKHTKGRSIDVSRDKKLSLVLSDLRKSCETHGILLGVAVNAAVQLNIETFKKNKTSLELPASRNWMSGL